MANVPPFVVVVGIFTIIGVTITIIKLALGLVDRKRKRVNFEIEEIEVRKQDPFSWDFIRIDVHVRNKSQRAITILDFNVSQKVQSKWEEHHIGDEWKTDRKRINPISPQKTKSYPNYLSFERNSPRYSKYKNLCY